MIGTPTAIYRPRGHGRWTKHPLRRRGTPTARQVAARSIGDPTAALHRLGGAEGDVATVGSVRVDGVETTHYRLTTNAAAVIAGAPEAASSKRRPATVDLWLDAHGRPRRMVFTLDAYAHANRVQLATSFHGYGAPLSIPLPPPSHVQTGKPQIVAGPSLSPAG